MSLYWINNLRDFRKTSDAAQDVALHEHQSRCSDLDSVAIQGL